jgi:hypothetical protein
MREKKEWERVGEEEKNINKVNPRKWGSWGLGFVIAQFVARIKGYKIEGQIGITGTSPTQCHHNGMVLSL